MYRLIRGGGICSKEPYVPLCFGLMCSQSVLWWMPYVPPYWYVDLSSISSVCAFKRWLAAYEAGWCGVLQKVVRAVLDLIYGLKGGP